MQHSTDLTVAAPIVRVQGDQVFANSRDVAEFFGKRHADVLRDVRNIETSTDANLRWFIQSLYEDAKGEPRLSYDMTRDGFTLLVMGYTDPQAREFKVRYIQAFNDMEAKLKVAAPALPDFLDPAAAAEAFAVEYRRAAAAETDCPTSDVG